MLQERDYQTYAIKRTLEELETTTNNPVIAMPTGTGKSVVIAGINKALVANYSDVRCLNLTHVKELVGQNAKAMHKAWPGAPIGIYSAGLKKKQLGLPITFGGIASVRKVAKEIGHIDLLGIDEAHLLNGNSDSMYQEFIKELLDINKWMRVFGTTATPFRQGMGMITENGIFNSIPVDMTGVDQFNWFIDNGWLTRLTPRPTETHFDISDVGYQMGDFAQGQLQKAMDKQDKAHYDALRELCAWGQNRRSWLIFATGNERTEWIAHTLNSWGIPTTYVHQGTSDRDSRIEAFKAGQYRVMVNNNVLTTGFDYAGIDLIGMMRPTGSPGLWVQMLGRGTRPIYAPGFDLEDWMQRVLAIADSIKPDCLVLDFAQNTERLGPVNDPRIPKKPGGGGGEAPIKICKTDKLVKGYIGCGIYVHASARNCPNCGAEFDFSVKITKHAGEYELVAQSSLAAPNLEWFDVGQVVYTRKVSGKTGIPYLAVTYRCGYKWFTENIFIEEKGFAKRRAKAWWASRSNLDMPPTVLEVVNYANRNLLRVPLKIEVLMKKDYPEIWRYEYE